MGSVVVHRKGTGDKLAFAQASIGPIWTGTLGWVTETGMSRHVFASLNEYLAEQGLLDSQKEERALEILSLLEKEFSDDAARRLPESSSPDELP